MVFWKNRHFKINHKLHNSARLKLLSLVKFKGLKSRKLETKYMKLSYCLVLKADFPDSFGNILTIFK